MRWLVGILALLLLAAPLAAVGLVALALEDEPRPTAGPPDDTAAVARARQLLSEHDPRRLEPGEIRELELSQADANRLLDELLRRVAPAAGRVTFGDRTLGLGLSLELPATPLGRYLNVEAGFAEDDGAPRLTRLRAGRLPVPTWLGAAAYGRALRWAEERIGQPISGGLVQELRFEPERVHLRYQWQPELLEVARREWLGEALSAEIAASQHALAAWTESRQGRPTRRLVELVAAVFAAAAERQGDPVVENRGALFVLEARVHRRSLEALVPGLPSGVGPGDPPIRLRGRVDYAQHFTVSALLAAVGDRRLADSVGVEKELADRETRSGFSFRDLLADRSGAQLGQRAVASRASALALQQRLAEGVADIELMPDPRGLPERLRSAAFEQRFGEVGSPEYLELSDEVDRRVLALELYR